MRFGWRDGRKIGQSGPDHAPVSRFRALDSEKDMPINDTSGPLFNASSPSAALQLSLESRLRARMDVNGSAGVRADLEHLGYACGCADMPAASVGAPHIRQRIWWVAEAPLEWAIPANYQNVRVNKEEDGSRQLADALSGAALMAGKADKTVPTGGQGTGHHAELEGWAT